MILLAFKKMLTENSKISAAKNFRYYNFWICRRENVSLFPSNGGRNDIVHHPREPIMDWGVGVVPDFFSFFFRFLSEDMAKSFDTIFSLDLSPIYLLTTSGPVCSGWISYNWRKWYGCTQNVKWFCCYQIVHLSNIAILDFSL